MYMKKDIGMTKPVGLRYMSDKTDLLYHREAVAEIIELANRSSLKRASLGDFAIAPLREDYDDAGYVQIRAAQARNSEELEFRFHLRAMGDILIDVQSSATQMLEAADQFERLIEKVYADGLRAAVNAAIGPTNKQSSPIRVAAIGLCPTGTTGHSAITIDLVTLGNDLNSEVARVIGWDLPEAQRELTMLSVRHEQREAMRRVASACGAIGWIDGVALRVLELSGLALPVALEMLQRKRAIEFDFEDANGQQLSASLYWMDGVINADLQPFDGDWSFTADGLSIKHPGHPETMIAAWAGRRIGDVVEQHFVPPGAVITSVTDVPGGWLNIALAVASQAIDRHVALSR